MKVCNFCGAPLDDDALFCANCGKKLENLGKRCPKCGTVVMDDSVFCAKCGARLDEQVVTPIESSQIVPPVMPLQEEEEVIYDWEKDEKARKWKIVIWSIVLIIILSAGGYFIYRNYNKNGSHSANEQLERKPIALKGSINETIGFSMKLHFNGNEVEGTEHYDNQKAGDNISIKGTIDENSYLTLHEYDKAVECGKFEGFLHENSYSGTFTNSKGKSFPFTADVINEFNMSEKMKKDITDSQLTENDDEFAFDAWSGQIAIYGGIYRNCQSLCVFELEKTSKDYYSGKIELLLGSEDEMKRFSSDFGMLEGKVRGKVADNTITIVLDEFSVDDTSGHFEYSDIKSCQQIFRLTYNDGRYSAEPIGKMEYFFDGVTDETKVYKK